MKTLYFTSSGRVMLDENNVPSAVNTSFRGIDDIYLVKEDTKVVVKTGEYEKEFVAEAGDILVRFYNDVPNKFIVVKNEEWKNNIIDYDEKEQKRKEEWAAAKKAPCENCCVGDCCDAAC